MSEATVEQIFVYPRRRQPGERRDDVIAISGQGLEGDHRRSAARSLTLLSAEAWEQTMAEMGADLPPSTRRANLVVRGIDLTDVMGRRMRVGGAEITVAGETTPCALMDYQRSGLQQALSLNLRGGVFGPVERTGRIRCGDPVTLID